MTVNDPIQFRYRTRQTTLDGAPILIVDTDIPEAAPPDLPVEEVISTEDEAAATDPRTKSQ